MSLNRALAALAVVAAVFVLAWLPRDPAASARGGAPRDPVPPRLAAPGAPAEHLASAPSPSAPAPSLPDEPPFRAQDFAVTSDLPEGPVVVLRSSARIGRDLAVELGSREPLPDGKRVFATVSVSDGLGNTIMDCTWRDIELTGDDAHKLACELPADVNLPLTISGHQRPAPSFVEAPSVVAIDNGVHR